MSTTKDNATSFDVIGHGKAPIAGETNDNDDPRIKTSPEPPPKKRTRRTSTQVQAIQLIGVAGVQALAGADLFIVSGTILRELHEATTNSIQVGATNPQPH